MSGSGVKFSDLSVLVVEDESLVFFVIEDLLLDMGCAAVWRAADVDAALSFLRDHRPDAAIVDVNLSGTPAYAVAARLDDLHIPVVFSTGYDRIDLPERWRERPMVQKPFTSDRLAAVLNAALAGRK